MQKFRTLLFPALTICFILVMGGYYLGRSSIDGPILITQHAPETTRSMERANAPAAATIPSTERENTFAPETTRTADRTVSSASTIDHRDAEGRIDLNRATLDELMTLPQIGEVRAGRILEFREAHGGFQTTAELMLVDGIGEKIFAGLRDLVYVEGQNENTDH